MSWENFDEEVRRGHPMAGCKICKLLEDLSAEDAKGLRRALENPANSARALKDALGVRGVKVAPDTVAKHREGRCSS